ncbi:hypothetical protein ACP4OV_005315 [Aristida adscensionis]
MAAAAVRALKFAGRLLSKVGTVEYVWQKIWREKPGAEEPAADLPQQPEQEQMLPVPSLWRTVWWGILVGVSTAWYAAAAALVIIIGYELFTYLPQDSGGLGCAAVWPVPAPSRTPGPGSRPRHGARSRCPPCRRDSCPCGRPCCSSSRRGSSSPHRLVYSCSALARACACACARRTLVYFSVTQDIGYYKLLEV